MAIRPGFHLGRHGQPHVEPRAADVGALREAGLEIPRLTQADAADLFAFFYAAQLFERRGDPARGQAVYQAQCIRCHGAKGPGKPAVQWEPLADSLELVRRLWNHAPGMNKALRAARQKWPSLARMNWPTF